MQTQLTGYRLSPQQARVWTLAQGSRAYRAQCALLIEGDLKLGVLREALRAVIHSHGALRTTFHRAAGVIIPIQVIAEGGDASWRSLDLSQQPADEHGAMVKQIIDEDAGLPYDYKQGPLFRSCLIKLSDRRHVLLMSLPALCADAGTLKNLFREISRHYSLGIQGDTTNEAVQYIQFSEWQHALLETEDAAAGKEFWSGRDKVFGELKLPFENRPADRAAYEPALIKSEAEPGLLAGVESLAKQYGVSAAAFLQAAWQTLLWRLTGVEDLVTGCVVDGRKFEELQEAMGLFAKCVPVPCRFDAGAKLSRIASRVEQATRDAYDWQEYFIPELGGELAARATGALIGFEFDERPAAMTAGGVTFSVYEQRACFEWFKLKLSCYLDGGSLVAEFHYDTERFAEAQIKSLAGQFVTLVKSAVRHPEATVSELETLDSLERQRLLFEFNDTACYYPQDRCLHQLFEEQVERTPGNVAVIFEGERLTFAELNARANQLARHLRGQGVGAESLVALCLERSAEMVIAILGTLKAGAAYLPLDPAYPRERLALLLADARPAVTLTQSHLESLLPPAPPKRLCMDSEWEAISLERGENLASDAGPDNLAYVIYTSGSTGRPKGVMIPHRGLVNYVSWSTKAYAVAEGRGSVVHSPLVFDLTVTSLFPPLLAGRGVELLREGQGVEDLSAALSNASDLSLIKITPAHLDALNHLLPAAEAASRTRALVIGGEALTANSLTFWRTHAPGTRLINEYGPTETVVGSCVYEVPAGLPLTGAVPIGQPIANTQIHLLDAQLSPVPFYVPGELYISGAGVARGYLNAADLTAEKFLPNPYSRAPGGRLYRTGDLARRLPDGNIEYLGRADHQVKIRGYRIEPGEIEAALGEHPGVREAVVMAREDEPGHKRLVAYVVPQPQASSVADELRRFLNERLPAHLVPAMFVELKSLPLTANGKVDRKALPPPDKALAAQRQKYVAPRNEVEELLCGIWAQVLGLERVGIHDNFFELGGDSIISIQIIARANQAGVHLLPKQLFEHQTIAELAAVAATAPASSSDQGTVTGALPLTPIQHWFFEQRLDRPGHFNQSLLLELRQPLRPALLDRAIAALLAHHDALRLRFEPTEQGWRQTNAAEESANVFSVIDLSAVDDQRQRPAIEAAANELQQSLDIGSGPLARVALMELGQGRPARLLMIIHHLAVDGVSWRILLEDLAAGYEQLASGGEIKLPPKTTSYQRWAESLVEYAQSAEAQQSLSYWREQLRQEVKPLPVDDAGGRNTVADIGVVTVWLSRERTRQLLKEVGEAYHTQINELLAAALAGSLSRWARTERVVMEMEWHGRESVSERVDITRTVGWFTAIYPVVMQVKQGEAAGERIKRIKEQVREATRRALSYGALRYLSGDEGVRQSLGNAPQGQLVFNYLGQLDEVLEGTVFRPAAELPGGNRGGREKRSYLLEVNASVTEGMLHLYWRYSKNLHRAETIEALAQSYKEALEELIEHCLSEGSGGYTPSDFPLAQIDQGDLDKAFGEIKFEG